MIRIEMTHAPLIDKGHVFLNLDPAVDSALSKWPELHARMNNSLCFTRLISGNHKNEFRCGLIRATLTELVSVEDVQEALIRVGRWKKRKVKLTDSGNPLLCVARALRNLDVHISSSTTACEARDFLWGNHEKPDDATQVNWVVHWIDNLDLSTFEQLRHFKKDYHKYQFSEALDWFDKSQKVWGIAELLYRTISIYADELASHS